MFVLDSSGSVGPLNFNIMKEFVSNVTQSLDVGKDNIHIGVIVYSGDAYTEFGLNVHSTKATTMSAINSIYYSGGTAEALDLLVDVMSQTGRGNITGEFHFSFCI